MSLFGSLVVVLQLDAVQPSIIWLVCAGLFALHKPSRPFVATAVGFGIGYGLYLQAAAHWIPDVESRELRVVLDRLCLTLIALPLLALSLATGRPFLRYGTKAQWDACIRLPFLWSGFHSTRVSVFLLIAILSNVLVFIPFFVRSGWPHFQAIWGFAIAFAFVNGILEELIWRGALLSRFSEQLGERWAVIVTSLGFGLQHYSLGFPWAVCVAFAFGGFFYGGLTVKSKSIVPAAIWHVTLNVFMVFSGWI